MPVQTESIVYEQQQSDINMLTSELGGNDAFLLMKGKASLHSSYGLLDGVLSLYRDRLVWNEVSSRSSNMLTISMDVLFGATLSPENKFKFKSFESASAANLKIKTSTHFTIYTITPRNNNEKRPLCDTWTFMVNSNEECATWVSLLRSAIHPNVDDKNINVLVLLNPVSGKRKAVKVFESIVKPIFEIGSTRYTLKVTESPTFATDFIRTEDLSKYSSVIVVSGDGLLHEVLNGFLARSDWPKHQNLPLGVIPAGSGNGLAKTIDCPWPEQAAVAVVKADNRPLDIMSATLGSGRTEYCFLSLTWGLTADIDIESERMRWAGPARFNLYGTMRIMNLRYYGGRLHYLPADDGETIDNNNNINNRDARQIRSSESHYNDEASASSSFTEIYDRTNQGMDDPWGLPPPSFSSPLIRKSPKKLPKKPAQAVKQAVTLRPTLTSGIQLPIIDGSLPPRWKTIEGPFVQVVATNVSWISTTFLACEHAKFSDGAIDLIYSGPVSKWQIIPYMTNPTRGNYMNRDGIMHVRAKAFILEPNGLCTTGNNDKNHKYLQSHGDLGINGPSNMAESTMSLIRTKRASKFASVRSAMSYPTKGTSSENNNLRTPMPVRVHSHNYTSSHHYNTVNSHTAPRGSSLLLLGLKDKGGVEGNDMLIEDRKVSTVVDTSFSTFTSNFGGPDALKVTVNGSMPPRRPEQAMVSPEYPSNGLPNLGHDIRLSMNINESFNMGNLSYSGGNNVQSNGIMSEKNGATPISPSLSGNDAVEQRMTNGGYGSSQACRMVGDRGIVDLDGEAVELGPVKIECLPNLVRLITAPWLNEGKPTNSCDDSVKDSIAPSSGKSPELIHGSLSREGSILKFTI